MKVNKGNLLTADHLQRMAKESSLNRSETLKEGNLEHQERRKNTRKNKIWVNTFPSSPVFSKFCLTSKEIIILSNIILNVYTSNTVGAGKGT